MIILITGGASGLGESITRRLSQISEHTVYFTYNNSVSNAAKIESEYTNAHGIKCNFKNKSELEQLLTKIEGLNPDLLINNSYSGSFIRSHFHKTQPEDFLKEFHENIIPTISITQAAINSFRKKKSGKIITVLTSALINHPPIGTSIYVANKAYLLELTKIWAIENAKFNITSNSVSPDFMLTAFTKEIDERVVEDIKDKNPHKRILTTEEAAEAILKVINLPQSANGTNTIINTDSIRK